MTIKKTTLSNELINAAVWGNSYEYCNASMTQGFVTNSLHHAEISITPRLAEDFLLHSKFHRRNQELSSSIETYLDSAGVAMVSLSGHEDVEVEDLITLPPSAPLSYSIEAALQKRRSVRRFKRKPISTAMLAALVRSAVGISASLPVELSDSNDSKQSTDMHLRTAPSAGSLYPIDLYFYANNVDGLSNGIYKYHPRYDKLSQHLDESESIKIFNAHVDSLDTKDFPSANVIFFLVATPWRSMRKYGTRGMRFLIHECGAISQNINLAASAMSLGSLECGGFYDDEVNELLQFDGVFKTFLHAVVVGQC